MYKKDQFKKLASGVTLMASAPTLASFALPGGSSSADVYKDPNIPSEYSGIDWYKVLKVLGYSVLAAVGISAVIYLAATLLLKKENDVPLEKFEDNHEDNIKENEEVGNIEENEGGKNENEDNHKANNIKENKEEKGGKNENENINVKGVEGKNIGGKQDEDGDVPEEKEGKLTLKGLVNKVCEKYKQLTQDMKSIKGQIREKEKEKEELENQYSQFREKCEQKMRKNEDNIEGEQEIIGFISSEESVFLKRAKEMLDTVDKCEKYCEFSKKIELLNSEKEKISRLGALVDESEDEDEGEYVFKKTRKNKYMPEEYEEEEKDREKVNEEDGEWNKKEEEWNKKEEEWNKKEEERKKKVSDLEEQIKKVTEEFKSFKQSNFAGTSYEEKLDEVMKFKNTGFLANKNLQRFKKMKSEGAKGVFEASNAILSIKDVSDSTTVLKNVKVACGKFVGCSENADKDAWKEEIRESIKRLEKAKWDEGNRFQEQLDGIRHSFESKEVDISKLELDLKVKRESRCEIEKAFRSWIYFRGYVEKVYGEGFVEKKFVDRRDIAAQFDQAKIDLGVNFES